MTWKAVGLSSVLVATCSGVAVHFSVGNDSIKDIYASYFLPAAAQLHYEKPATSTSPWDDNWDFRDPAALVHKSINKSDPGYKEALKKVTPTASRNIILVRHGQYHLNGDLRGHLTKLGNEQAHITGERLKMVGLDFDKVYVSTMVRAQQTAENILTHLAPITPIPCNMLREGVPIAPEPPLEHYNPSKTEEFTDSVRIEAAFRNYFHRADPDQKKDTNELLVCHGNVIRYFVCRSLQFPPEAWLRFSLAHGSITSVTIRPNGRVYIRSIGSAGHFPPEKVSFM